MSGILHFPSILYFREIQTGEIAYCGRFQLSEAMQLQSIRLMLYKGGAHGSTEFRISAYSNASLTRRLYSSDWFAIADIPDVGNHWLGYVRVGFALNNVNPNNPIYFGIETQNYTHTPSFALNFALDWPYEVNDNANPAVPGVRMELFGLKEYAR